MSNDTLEQLQKLLSQKKSKQYYSEKLGITVEEVNDLMKQLKDTDNEPLIEEGEKPRVVEEKVNDNGSREIRILSNKPLTKREIEDLYSIDNISTRLSTYWNKETPSGKFLTSALIKCLIEDFYTKAELTEKLEELFPDLSPLRLPSVRGYSDKALFIYISDDHCGLVLQNSLYGNEYSGSVYESRLSSLLSEIVALDQKFESVVVINLGDEVDGYNAKTTRYDHTLDSLSNKEQFDIFTKGKSQFFLGLFTSGISPNYQVINLNNSNHSGLGFAYMANKAVELYINGKFPQVEFTNVEKFIETIEYGNHVFGLCHGKDEKYMKSPMPLNLDHKTDLWLFEYYDNKGLSPKTRWISTIKGDIHKFNSNQGRSGRYVNIPSISSGSTWLEHNYGNSKPGAVIEIVDKDSPNILTQPIWFNQT